MYCTAKNEVNGDIPTNYTQTERLMWNKLQVVLIKVKKMFKLIIAGYCTAYL